MMSVRKMNMKTNILTKKKKNRWQNSKIIIGDEKLV